MSKPKPKPKAPTFAPPKFWGPTGPGPSLPKAPTAPTFAPPVYWGPTGPGPAITGHPAAAPAAPAAAPQAAAPAAAAPAAPAEPAFNQNAFDYLRNFFTDLGIAFDGDVETVIRNAMLAGYGPDQIDFIMPEIQKTNAFKARFPGFHSRVSNGYNAINVGDYIQLENTYHRIMQEAGLPAGFYDSPSDFGNWIANNVSPDEIQNRVSKAVSVAKSVDPTARNLMAQFYGLSTGDIASYFLDQSRALPVIERQYNAANVAAWAQRSGFDVNGMTRYEDLVDKGITIDQAAQQYGTVKTVAETFGKLGGVYGQSYSQTDAENDVFFSQNDKRRRLVAQEAATFGGSSSGATGSAKRQSY
jgi:hypothetical protein